MSSFAAEESRRLLAQMRSVMAGRGSAQARLDKTVRVIAEGMQADVCSCYVMRAGEVLELFATHGLDQQAVHVTRLRVGEGLVGEIAAHTTALALADAWSHPQFVYRPETGEDFFRSLMGVPLIQANRVIGVLAVQTKEERKFDPWQVETLETVAMVVAELMSATELVNRSELFPADGSSILPQKIQGVGLNSGVGIGQALLHKPDVRVGRLVADDPVVEKERLHTALAELSADVDKLLALRPTKDGDVGKDYEEVLETYRMIAMDSGLIRKIETAIDSGLTAEAATQKVHEETRIRMEQISNPIIREKILDLDDLNTRILRALTDDDAPVHVPENSILVAHSLGPAELLGYETDKLAGLVMEEGSSTMHAVVIAKALDIPVVAQVKKVFSRVDSLDPLIIDGDSGQLMIRPAQEMLEIYSESARALVRQKEEYERERDLPSETKDGTSIELLLNAGLEIDLPAIEQTGVQGIGLFRTELSFLAAAEYPGVAHQTALYERILKEAKGRPVTFRTLDVGGDKVLPFWQGPLGEENPAMGWRALRIGLDQPGLLKQQIRAMCLASGGETLRLLFPMITTVEEVRAARALAIIELDRCRDRGLSVPAQIEFGAMIEVPALLWQLEELSQHIDFICVGTNDLVQFVFASDRGNARVHERYDALSQPILRLLQDIQERAQALGLEVTVCGEMAGQPIEVLALIGLGYRRLSMQASAVGPIRRTVRSVDLNKLTPFVASLSDHAGSSVRSKVRAFAQDHGISLRG